MIAIFGSAWGRAAKTRPAAALAGLVFALLMIGLLTPVRAATNVERTGDVNTEIAALRAETDQQKIQLEAQQNQIEQLRMMVEGQTQILRQAGFFRTPGQGASSRRVQLISDTPSASDEGAAPQGGATAERPKSERTADQLLVEAGGVLLPRGVLQIEPSADVTHVSNPRVNIFGYTVFNAINIGTIRVDDLSQDVLNNNLTVRLGLPFRTQLDFRAPFTNAFVRQTKGIGTGVITELSTQGHHLGDLQATLSWQPVIERGWIPAIVVRARTTFPTGESVFQIPLVQGLDQTNGAETDLTRAPTGSGYFSIEPGFTAVWRSDPLMLFVGASYSYTMSTPHYIAPTTVYSKNSQNGHLDVTHTIHDYGIIDPGDVIGFNAGLNFVVNERASINFSFVDLYTTYTRQRVPASRSRYHSLLGTTVNDARLGLGASFGLTDNVALVVNAGMGLTDQAPGYTFAVSVPITLPLHW